MTTTNDVFSTVAPLHVPKVLADATKQKDTPSNRDWLCKHSGFAYKICAAFSDLCQAPGRDELLNRLNMAYALPL